MNLLRAEWTKLRSVNRWMLTLLAAGVLTVGFGLVAASGGRTEINQHPNFIVGPKGQPVLDDFMFVHRPLSGDGTIAVRVVDQADSHEWAGAGVIVKQSLTSGSRYALVMTTPRHGVRFRSDFDTDIPATAGLSSRWLKLSRSGGTVTGFESADGASWRELGRVAFTEGTVEIGLFVSSPPHRVVERRPGGATTTDNPTVGTAVFDNVTTSAPGRWSGSDVRGPGGYEGAPTTPGTLEERDDVLTVHGSGGIGPNPPDDDPVSAGLYGVLMGLMAIIAVSVLFVTSEYKRGMILTTLAAHPGRVRMLAAKAAVAGTAAFVVALAGSAIAFLVTQPLLRDNGFRPPAYQSLSITDPSVLRALGGTAVFVACVAVFALAVGVIMRHSAAAITTTVALVILPTILSIALPPAVSKWILQLTLTAGFALQRAKPPTNTVEPWANLEPWSALTVCVAYAATGFTIAAVLLRRRDA